MPNKSFVTLALIIAALLLSAPAPRTYAATATSCTDMYDAIEFPPDNVIRPNRYNALNWDAGAIGCNGDGKMLVDLIAVAPNYSQFYTGTWGAYWYPTNGGPAVQCSVRSDGRTATCRVEIGQNATLFPGYFYADAWGTSMPGCPHAVNIELQIKRASDGLMLVDDIRPIWHTC